MADFKATAISGSLTRVVSGDTYLIGGANIDITTGSDGRVTIVGTGGGGSSEWTRAAGDIYPTTNPTTTDVLVGNTAIATANTVLLAGGGAIFNEQGAQADFRIESDTKTHAFFIDGSTDQVLILSGGAATSPNEALGTDVAVFVSGAIGSLGSSTKGSSLFGGDALFSGSIRVLNSGKNGGTISGSIHHTEDGLSYLVGSGLVTVSSASNGQITISATGDGSSEWTRNGNNIYPNSPTTTSVYVGDTDSGNPDIIMASNGAATFNEQGGQVDFRVETDGKENALLIKGASNQILILSGGAAASTDSASGTAVAFFVSGTIGSRGTPVRGASVFGGDVIHSGSVAILDPGGTDENLRLVRGPSGNNYIVFEDADGTDRGQIYSNGLHLFLRANTNDLIFRAGTKMY